MQHVSHDFRSLSFIGHSVKYEFTLLSYLIITVFTDLFLGYPWGSLQVPSFETPYVKGQSMGPIGREKAKQILFATNCKRIVLGSLQVN